MCPPKSTYGPLRRPSGSIEATASRMARVLSSVLGRSARVESVPVRSQIGSGARPVDSLASAGVRIIPLAGRGKALEVLAASFRRLPVPVIGRIEDGALVFDCRCLECDEPLLSQLAQLDIATHPC